MVLLLVVLVFLLFLLCACVRVRVCALLVLIVCLIVYLFISVGNTIRFILFVSISAFMIIHVYVRKIVFSDICIS